ncbi:MAG: hypothetical protein HQL61_17315 [Magnetococcales bacterium]|nr:hypothetical protein [Nitrospirota bacterium]
MITVRGSGSMERGINQMTGLLPASGIKRYLWATLIFAYIAITFVCNSVEGACFTTPECNLKCDTIEADSGNTWLDYYKRGVSFSDCGQDKLENGQKEGAIKYLEFAVNDLEAGSTPNKRGRCIKY